MIGKRLRDKQSRNGLPLIERHADHGIRNPDGVRFTVFDASNSPELPSNRLTSFLEGPDGGLWATTEQGYLVRFLKVVLKLF